MIIVQVSAQDNFSNQLSLQGAVKSIYEATYHVTLGNGIIGKGELIQEALDTLYFTREGELLTVTQSPLVSSNNDSIACLYDLSGRCIKRYVYYPTKQLKQSQTFVYNEQGQIKLCIVRSTDEEVVDAISYSYDPYGKLAIKISSRKDGEMSQQRFAYDQMGNWIVRVDFDEYEPVRYVERKIEYYQK